MAEVRAGDGDPRPKVIQAQVHRSGAVHVWYQVAPGQRAFARLTDQAFSDGLATLIGDYLADYLGKVPPPPGEPPVRPPIQD